MKKCELRSRKEAKKRKTVECEFSDLGNHRHDTRLEGPADGGEDCIPACQLLAVSLREFLHHVPKPPFPRSNMYANWSLFQLSSQCLVGDQCSMNVSLSSLLL